MNGKNIFVLLIFVLFVGRLIYVDFVLENINKADLCRDGICVKGVILGIAGGNDMALAACYSFLVNGDTFFGTYTISADIGYGKGDTVNILYLEKNPDINALPEELPGCFASSADCKKCDGK